MFHTTIHRGSRDIWWVCGRLLCCSAYPVRLTEEELLDALARMSFADTLELAGILGEAYSTVHRALKGLLPSTALNRDTHHCSIAVFSLQVSSR